MISAMCGISVEFEALCRCININAVVFMGFLQHGWSEIYVDPSASLPSDSRRSTEERLAVRQCLLGQPQDSPLLLLEVGYLCLYRLGVGNLSLNFSFKMVFPSLWSIITGKWLTNTVIKTKQKKQATKLQCQFLVTFPLILPYTLIFFKYWREHQNLDISMQKVTLKNNLLHMLNYEKHWESQMQIIGGNSLSTSGGAFWSELHV